MADSELLLLNLSEENSQSALPNSSRTAKRIQKRQSKYSKAPKASKQQPAQAVKRQAALPTPTLNSSLKGYELEHTPAAPQREDRSGAVVPASIAAVPAASRRAPSKGDPIPGGKRTDKSLHEGRPAQPQGKTARPVTVAAPAAAGSEDEGLMEAVALSMRKDQSVAVQLGDRQAPHESDSEEEEAQAGFVSFVDERLDHSRMPKRKKKDHAEALKPAKRRKGLGNVHPKTGELVHAGQAVPEALRAVVLGTQSVSTFAELGLAESLATHLEEMNFTAPSRIQQQCIPVLKAGRDALVNAPTGSGKTLAYLAPIINDLQGEQPRLNRGDGTFAIIVAPTRELCIQINDVLSLVLRRYHWLVGGAITGGENRSKEKARLRRGVTVLVATPGRLLDHLQSTAAFHTNELRWLVLDEADRLLDLGFEQKIQLAWSTGEIVDIVDERLKDSGSRRRQTVLLSATMTSQLKALASLSLQDLVAVGFSSGEPENAGQGGDRLGGGAEFGGREGDEAARFAIPEQLVQRYLQVSGRQRLGALAGVLCRATRQQAQPCKLVVFMSSCDGVEFHHQLLQGAYKHAAGWPLLTCPIWKLHGNLPQTIRTQTFLDFSRCTRGVLFCTDVAARGLDFPAVTCIVQYDPPGEATEYVHRVGRTARMGQQGEAILFLLPAEIGYLELLAKTGCRIAEMDLDGVMRALPAVPNQSAGKGLHSVDEHEPAAVFAFQGRLVSAVTQDPHLRALAGDAFRSFVRAYATHPASLRDIFHVKRLHLGHVAHSFALKETPTLLGRSASKLAAKQVKKGKLGGKGKQHLKGARQSGSKRS